MRHRISRSLGITIILAVVAAGTVASAVSLIRQAVQVSRDAAATHARLAELTAKKQALEAEIRERTTEDGVRYQAHLRLNLKNPGEHAVVVLPEEKPSGTTDAPSWRERIKDFFIDIGLGKFFVWR